MNRPPRFADHGGDATAMGVANDNDMVDGQLLDGKLQRRAGTMVAATLLVGRDQRRDVAHREDIAGFRL